MKKLIALFIALAIFTTRSDASYKKSQGWGQHKPSLGSQVNRGDPIMNGLVGWYIFNEGGGQNVFNLIAPYGKGAFTNVSSSNPSWAPNNIHNGPSLSFPTESNTFSLGGYADVSDTHYNLSGEMTVLAWINLHDTASSGNFLSARVIASNATASQQNWYFEVGRISGGILSFVQGNALPSPSTNNTAMTAGKWYQVGLVRTGSTGSWTITYYLNGRADGAGTMADNPDATGTIKTFIGSGVNSGGGGAQFFGGYIDNVMIFSRALKPSEIMRMYSDPFAGISAYRRGIVHSPSGLIGFPEDTYAFPF